MARLLIMLNALMVDSSARYADAIGISFTEGKLFVHARVADASIACSGDFSNAISFEKSAPFIKTSTAVLLIKNVISRSLAQIFPQDFLRVIIDLSYFRGGVHYANITQWQRPRMVASVHHHEIVIVDNLGHSTTYSALANSLDNLSHSVIFREGHFGAMETFDLQLRPFYGAFTPGRSQPCFELADMPKADASYGEMSKKATDYGAAPHIVTSQPVALSYSRVGNQIVVPSSRDCLLKLLDKENAPLFLDAIKGPKVRVVKAFIPPVLKAPKAILKIKPIKAAAPAPAPAPAAPAPTFVPPVKRTYFEEEDGQDDGQDGQDDGQDGQDGIDNYFTYEADSDRPINISAHANFNSNGRIFSGFTRQDIDSITVTPNPATFQKNLKWINARVRSKEIFAYDSRGRGGNISDDDRKTHIIKKLKEYGAMGISVIDILEIMGSPSLPNLSGFYVLDKTAQSKRRKMHKAAYAHASFAPMAIAADAPMAGAADNAADVPEPSMLALMLDEPAPEAFSEAMFWDTFVV